MVRMNCAEILRKRKEENEALTLIYEKTYETYPFWQDSSIQNDNSRYKASWTRKSKKYTFIYKVIFSATYWVEEGNKLNVSDGEIQDVFNSFARRLEVVESFDHLDEFSLHLYNQCLSVLAKEKGEVNDYNKQSTFRKWLDKDSTLDLQLKEINVIRRTLNKLNNELESAIKDWRFKKINETELDEIRNLKDKDIWYFEDYLEHLTDKYKRVSETAKYKRRKFLKSCFDRKDQLIEQPVENPKLIFKNTSSLSFMISEYCKWFNKVKFPNEIKQAVKDKNNARLKGERAFKVAPRQLELERRTNILTPYIDSNKSYAKIAIEVDLPKSTVQRILNTLREK